MDNKFQNLLDLHTPSHLKETNTSVYNFLFKFYLSKEDDQFISLLNMTKLVLKEHPTSFDLLLQNLNMELINLNNSFKTLNYNPNAIKLSKRIFMENERLNFNLFLSYINRKYQVNSSDFYKKYELLYSLIDSLCLELGYSEEDLLNAKEIAPINGGILEKINFVLGLFLDSYIPYVNYQDYFSTVEATSRNVIVHRETFSINHPDVLQNFHEIFFKELEMFGLIKKYDSNIEMWI